MVVRAPARRGDLLGAYGGVWAEVAERLGVSGGLRDWGGYLRGFDGLGPALLFWHEHHPRTECPFR